FVIVQGFVSNSCIRFCQDHRRGERLVQRLRRAHLVVNRYHKASPSSDPSATSWNCTLSDDFEADYRLISSMLDLSVSSILKMEEDILNAVVDYARKTSINGKQATHEEGVFHYETYNEVLKLHDPNALL
ncbi:hypothetical protein COOONC_19448, partial [Cooperia oncophora]